MEPTCELYENETHVFRTFKLNECGTQVSYSLTSMIYRNLVRTVNSELNSIIIRRKTVQLSFECEYTLQNKHVARSKYQQHGSFDNQISEETNSNYASVKTRDISASYKALPGEISIDINPAKSYLVQFQAKDLPKTDTVVYPVFCYSTPIQRSLRWMRYILIERG